MRSTEVYRILRNALNPWCKSHGFRRSKAFLSWHKPVGDQFVTFWFQCSQDGWDDYAGSKFVVEFQGGDSPEPGHGSRRVRLAGLLTPEELHEVTLLQNEVIAKLQKPPPGHWDSQWYRSKFRRVEQDYIGTDDVWLRYHDPEDVRRWAEMVQSVLPGALERSVGSDGQAR